MSLKELSKNFTDAQIIKYGDFNGITAWFPRTPRYRELWMTKEGLYSTSSPGVMATICGIIAERMGITIADLKKLTVVDATANVGGSVLGFAERFERVVGVEIDEFTYGVLVHNIGLYAHENVTLSHADFLHCCLIDNGHNNPCQSADVVFIDPPWGGVDYLGQKTLPLNLSGVDLGEIVGKLAAFPRIRCIALKVPVNFARDTVGGIKNFTTTYHQVKNFLVVAMAR